LLQFFFAKRCLDGAVFLFGGGLVADCLGTADSKIWRDPRDGNFNQFFFKMQDLIN
jgi:hypothetical protein